MDILDLLARVRAILSTLWRDADAWTAERMLDRPPEVTRFRREATVAGTRVRMMFETISGPAMTEAHTHEGPIAMEVLDGQLTVSLGTSCRDDGTGPIQITQSRLIIRNRGMSGIAHAAAASYALRGRADAHGLLLAPPAVRVLTVVGPEWNGTAPPTPSPAVPLSPLAVPMERIAWSKILSNIGYL